MARRKQEIAIQIELETQEDWEGALSQDGLLVVDVYQEWAGPCVGMVSNFRRLKNEIGDDLLRFAVAKADTIDSLERYRGKCEPCFLLYAGGSLVYHVAGARAPVLTKAIPDQLAAEHKVLAGDAERKSIRDPMFEEKPEKAEADAEETEKEEVEVEKEVTVCLIKPDAVEAGKVDEIIEQLEAHGMEILKQEVRQLTEEEAKSFYAAHEEEEYYEDLVKFMCSGPSHVLVLSQDSGENIIAKFRDLMGPKAIEEAKEQAPESLRAQYGTNSMSNAVHGSDDKDKAMKELAFFFPDYAVPTHKITQKKQKVQRTLALIRPDALRDHKDDILAKIKESGFQIAFQKEVQLTKEQAAEFYKEHEGEDYFEELTNRMSSGPLLALALARLDAVDGWRGLLGPKEVPKAKEEAPNSLRAQYSVDEDLINPVHGSDSVMKAQEELNFFFPVQQTVAVVKPDAYQTKDEIIKRIHEAGFRIAARKETQLTKEIAEQIYDENREKEYFDSLTEHVSSGQTLFLVLSREDAVDGWRSLIGPTDPAVAKEEAPGTIRAELGEDVVHNAVHGSSDPEHAKREMELVFGEMEFNEDGSVKGAEPDLDAAVVERDPEQQQAEGESSEAAAVSGEEGGEATEGEQAEQTTEGTEGEGAEQATEGEQAEQTTEGEGAEQVTEGTEGEQTATAGAETAAGDESAEQAEVADGADAPAESTDAPADSAAAPADSADAPGDSAEAAPTEGDAATGDSQAAETSDESQAPVGSTEAPAEPVEQTETAGEEKSAEPEADTAHTSSEEPAASTEAPAESTETPAESTDAPAESTDAPAESTDAPAESTETPAESTDAPAESADAPAESTDAPAESTDAPAESTDAPAESTDAPAESTDAPAASGEEQKTEADVEQTAQ